MIKRCKVEKVTVKAEGLDPINVIFEDGAPGYGKTTIEVFGECWAYSWAGLADRKMEQFFRECGFDYLVRKFAGSMSSEVEAHDGVQALLRLEIIEMRKELSLTKGKARELYDDVASVPDDAGSDYLGHSSFPVHEVLGDEWWYCLPKEPNPSYQYLERVIKAVRDELEKEFNQAAA